MNSVDAPTSQLPRSDLLDEAKQAARRRDWSSASSIFRQWHTQTASSTPVFTSSLIDAYFLAINWAAGMDDAPRIGELVLDLVERSAATEETFKLCLPLFDAALARIDFACIENERRRPGLMFFRKMPRTVGRVFGDLGDFLHLEAMYKPGWRSSYERLSAKTLRTLVLWSTQAERPDIAYALAECGSLRHPNDGPWELETLGQQRESYVNRRRMLAAKFDLMEEYTLRLSSAWLAWPRGTNVLSWSRSSESKTKALWGFRLKTLGESDLVRQYASELDVQRFVDSAPAYSIGSDEREFLEPALRAGDSDYVSDNAAGWGDFVSRSSLLTYFASPVAWTVVWILPLVLIWSWTTLGFAGEPFFFALSTVATSSGTGIFILVWLAALSRCRVTRVLRIGSPYGDCMYLAAPCPLYRLFTTEDDLARLNPVYAEAACKQFMVQSAGTYISVNGVLFRKNVFAGFGIESKVDLFGALGWGALIAMAALVTAACAGWLWWWSLTQEALAPVWAAPYFALLLAATLIGGIGGTAGLLLIVLALVLLRPWKKFSYTVGAYDDRRKFIPLYATSSGAIATAMLGHVQQRVSNVVGGEDVK